VSVDKARIIERSSGRERSFRRDRVTGGSEFVLDYFVLQKISGFGPQKSIRVRLFWPVLARHGRRRSGCSPRGGETWSAGSAARTSRCSTVSRTSGCRRCPRAEDVEKALRTIKEIPQLPPLERKKKGHSPPVSRPCRELFRLAGMSR